MRLIDADALREGLVSNHPVAIAAACAPTIDAEPVRHGHYGFVGMNLMAGVRSTFFGTCSECRERIIFDPNHNNYCPNCGAKMVAEVEG